MWHSYWTSSVHTRRRSRASRCRSSPTWRPRSASCWAPRRASCTRSSPRRWAPTRPSRRTWCCAPPYVACLTLPAFLLPSPPLSPSPSPQPSLPHPLLVPYTCPLRTPASTRPPPGARGRRLHHQPAQPLRHPPVGVRHGQSGAPNQRGQRTARLQPHDGRLADRLLRTGAQRGQEAATILLQDARVALRRAVSEGPGRGHPRLVRAGRAYRDRFVFMPCM